MGLLDRILRGAGGVGPDQDAQAAHLDRLGLPLRAGRDPYALHERYHPAALRILEVPYYALLFNGAAVPRDGMFQSSSVVGGFGVQVRIDGEPLPLDVPPPADVPEQRAEARLGEVTRAVTAEMGGTGPLRSVQMTSWHETTADGVVHLSYDDPQTGSPTGWGVPVRGGSLRAVVAAITDVLKPPGTAGLCTVDPVDVEHGTSPWVWYFVMPEDRQEEFEQLLHESSLAVIEQLERTGEHHRPRSMGEVPAELTTPGSGAPRRPAAPEHASVGAGGHAGVAPVTFEVTEEDRALFAQSLTMLRRFGIVPRLDLGLEHAVWDADTQTEFRFAPLHHLIEHSHLHGDKILTRTVGLDNEFVRTETAYADLLEHLAAVAGTHGRLNDVRTYLGLDDPDAGTPEQGWICYRIDGERREYSIEIVRDVPDPGVIEKLLEDVAPSGCVPVITDGYCGVHWVPQELEQEFLEVWEADKPGSTEP